MACKIRIAQALVYFNDVQRGENPVTVFMGVPTMYNYLLSKFKEMSQEDKEKARKAASRLRLTVSGSAACPVPVMKQWEEISGEASTNANKMSLQPVSFWSDKFLVRV